MLGKMSSGIKCVVFDFDDTLADTKRVVELIKKIEPDKKFLAGRGWVFSKREFEKARKIMENKVENQRQNSSVFMFSGNGIPEHITLYVLGFFPLAAFFLDKSII